MKITITLLSTLFFISTAVSEDQLHEISTNNDLGYFMQTFYLHPRPDLINSSLKYIDTSGAANIQNARASILMSYSCIFSMYSDKDKKPWKSTIKQLNNPAKQLLLSSLESTPEQHLNNTKPSPAKNDMNWACYFATGKEEYLDSIIDTLHDLSERSDILKYLTAASAKWSLAANINNHPKLATILELKKNDANNSLAQVISEILTTPPQEIREQTTYILKAQKSAGIWK